MELSAALEMSTQSVAAAARARQFPLEPPRALEGDEFLGMFTTNGDLMIADPCRLAEETYGARDLVNERLGLAHDVEALAGRWYAYVRPGALRERDRTAELVVIHEAGFDVPAVDSMGWVAVDSGMAGVFDRACPAPGNDTPTEEGIVFGLGAVACSGQGDGSYEFFGGSARGAVAKLSIHFLGPTPADLDTTVVRRELESRPSTFRAE